MRSETRNLSVDTVLRLVERVSFQRLDEELLALDADRGYVYSINAIGETVRGLFREPRSVGAACEELTRRFAVDEPTCRREVLAFLERLLDAGLMEIVDAPTPARP